MKNFIKKISSRKFIVTAISAISGIITLFIGDNEIVNTVASALMIILPTVVYCITEGILDSKSIKTITETVVDTAEKLGANEEQIKVIEKIGEVGEVLTDKPNDE